MLGIIIIFSSAALLAQTATRDVVYLKNGSVIHGVIIETIPNTSIKIQTADGNIFVYNFSDIEKFGRESAAENEPVNSPMLYARPAVSTSPSFSIFAGASFPMGDFASTTSDNAGSAQTGFAGGLQFVTGGQVGLLISALYASNSIDQSDITGIVSSGNFRSLNISGVNSAGNWQSIMMLLGLKIGTANATGANFFVAPLVGIDLVKSPDITVSAGDNPYVSYVYNGNTFYGYVPVTGNLTMQSASATALTYGGMMEFEFGHVTLGARYLLCKPKFDISSSGTMTGSGALYNATAGYITVNETETINSWSTQPSISMIIAYLGISF